MRCRWCGMETENTQACDWCRRNPLGESPEVTLARERALAQQQRQREVNQALSRIDEVLKNAEARGMLSDEEEATITAIIHEANLTEPEIMPILPRLQRMLLLRDIAAGNLPSLPAPDTILLRRNEICHWYGEAKLYKTREEVEYKGNLLGGSLNLGGGFFLNLGSVGGKWESSQNTVPVGKGLLLITSQRLIFFAPPTLLELGLQEVVSVQYDESMVAVYTSSASSPLFFLVADGELTGRILHQACRLA